MSALCLSPDPPAGLVLSVEKWIAGIAANGYSFIWGVRQQDMSLQTLGQLFACMWTEPLALKLPVDKEPLALNLPVDKDMLFIEQA